MSRIRGPYVRFCKRDEAATPHPTCCLVRLRTIEGLGFLSAMTKRKGAAMRGARLSGRY